jgi:hypothetical protein
MFRLTVMMMVACCVTLGAQESAFTDAELGLRNTVPPLNDPDDPRAAFTRAPGSLPLAAAPFIEHVRGAAPDALATGPVDAVSVVDGEVVVIAGGIRHMLPRAASGDTPTAARRSEPAMPSWLAPRLWDHPDAALLEPLFPERRKPICNDIARQQDTLWIATDRGLFFSRGRGNARRHMSYGVDGPLATRITALAVDGEDRLWVGTPRGISIRTAEGAWSTLLGKQGLPYEDITALHFAGPEQVWIGTTRGAILHTPSDPARQWYYRAGQRYLPNDHVVDIATEPGGDAVYFATKDGLGRIDLVTRTLGEKAAIIEDRVNERHRRFGLVAACRLDDAHNPTSHTIGDNDNDGLWTAYHVAALALAYAVTGDPAAKASARESMHAVIMLQNASGTPGLVARSVVPEEIGKTKNEQWRPTPDGTMYWKSDTSSDEIDGHYFAFYTYWEHVARHDPAEAALIRKQVTDLTDYIVDNNYQLIDWHGRRTRWGFWNPEALNHTPMDYLENGLNSLQILSFLKTAHHITGNPKYADHYRKLIIEHGYLDNVLLEKKVFPDENNHSDNQLAYVAWYPILQLEQDPKVREALRKAVRRHYRTLVDDKSSFFFFVTATIDPDYVELEKAVENLQEIPTDRRTWQMENSHRADVVFDPRVDRFGAMQLLHVLPADERNFEKWNKNLFLPDGGGDGRLEDDGAAYLLPYWMGRYHGFFSEH